MAATIWVYSADGSKQRIDASNPLAVSAIGAGGGAGSVTLEASEVHIGEVGADGATIVTQFTNTLPAYVAGDCVGGVQAVNNVPRVAAGHCILNSMTLWDRDSQSEPYYIWLFTDNPTASTFTDAAPAVLAAADRAKIVPGSPLILYAGEYLAVNSGGVYVAKANMGVSFELNNTTMWVALEAIDTPDYANTDALTLLMDFLRD